MIDFVKIEVSLEKFTLSPLENPKLSFKMSVDADWVLIPGDNPKAKFKNLDLEIHVQEKAVIIEGSIHKFWNGNDSNSNDFPQWAVRQTIEEISEELYFSPKDARIVGLEYGVNIAPPVLTTEELISRMITYNWRTPFESLKSIVGRGHGKQAKSSNYKVKGYDKGLQERTSFQIFRLEIKTLRSKDLAPIEVKTLHDLCNSKTLERLGHMFQERISHIFFEEDLELPEGFDKEEKLYLKAINPLYWKKLKRWKRDDEKRKVHSLIEKYAKTTIANEVQTAARQKWESLRKCNVFTWFCEKVENETTASTEEKKCNVFTLLKEKNVTLNSLKTEHNKGRKRRKNKGLTYSEMVLKNDKKNAEVINLEKRLRKQKFRAASAMYSELHSSNGYLKNLDSEPMEKENVG
ncbi:hypothetical protein [Runella sp. SP2]|uniref:hypothetical protein n=1 Tax=Runella sp. SP2 TaxID=2268026 RepID=UPI000F074DE5|nr:hypothetical protein [Runella sp. SP2]AYQ31084.1 hypothetical protein DTQ70_02325 [Runella sp. SP2]